jgi:hypothetical protein
MLISNRNPERISILMIRFCAPVRIESATKRTEVTATAQARQSIGCRKHSGWLIPAAETTPESY